MYSETLIILALFVLYLLFIYFNLHILENSKTICYESEPKTKGHDFNEIARRIGNRKILLKVFKELINCHERMENDDYGYIYMQML